MKLVFSSFCVILGYLAVIGGSKSIQAAEFPRPEITIGGTEAGRVKSALVNRIADSDYRLTKSSEFTLEMEKKLTDAGSLIFLSNPGGGLADMRVTYTISPLSEGSVRIVASLNKITHSIVADYSFDASDSPEVPKIQALLDLVASDIAKPNFSKRGRLKQQ